MTVSSGNMLENCDGTRLHSLSSHIFIWHPLLLVVEWIQLYSRSIEMLSASASSGGNTSRRISTASSRDAAADTRRMHYSDEYFRLCLLDHLDFRHAEIVFNPSNSNSRSSMHEDASLRKWMHWNRALFLPLILQFWPWTFSCDRDIGIIDRRSPQFPSFCGATREK